MWHGALEDQTTICHWLYKRFCQHIHILSTIYDFMNQMGGFKISINNQVIATKMSGIIWVAVGSFSTGNI